MKKKIKFSIIIPVYNTEKYLKKCLDSVFNQTYNNYEVIAINDGSTDNSEELIKKYDNLIYLKQANQGLSMARNNGIKKANGDYLIFLDSDDYIEKDLLLNLSEEIKNQDIVRYQLAVTTNKNSISYSESSFDSVNGGQAFELISKFNFIENAYLYAIKRSYWADNNFEFKKNRYHEDFGIIPEILFKANSVSCINYVGYNYYQRENSIMNNINYEKEVNKSFDVLEQGIETIKSVEDFSKYDEYKNLFYSYVVNSIFIKLKYLKGNDAKKYIKIIKDNNLIIYLLNDKIKRKVKKLYYKVKYKL